MGEGNYINRMCVSGLFMRGREGERDGGSEQKRKIESKPR